MSETDSRNNAVSIYAREEALDDFPVLKAFQQYIDAEQAKARKRLTILCIFFGCMMCIVVAVFVALLMSVSSRNQVLSDRFIDYAMNRDRTATGSQVVVQSPQDNSPILALTARVDALQKKLADEHSRAEKAAAEAAEKAQKAQQAAVEAALAEAARPKEPTAAELEVQRLKALLAIEKEKNSLEQKRQKEAELEAYRRKHYPELYERKEETPTPPVPKQVVTPATKREIAQPVVTEPPVVVDKPAVKEKPAVEEKPVVAETVKPVDQTKADAVAAADMTSEEDIDDDEEDVDIDALIEEIKAKTYFDEQADRASSMTNKPEKEYSIPVEVKGSSMNWNIPND